MATLLSLLTDCAGILDSPVSVKKTTTIPNLSAQDILLNSNDGKEFIASILFIDLRESTQMFARHYDTVIGKMISAYHKGITQIAKDNGGEIRSFNGDSLLVFFEGDTKGAINSSVKCAMQITYFINHILNPLLQRKNYSKLDFGIGVDHGKVLCLKVGISGEGNRDLVWISESVNKAAKLSDFGSSPNHIHVSKKVYINLFDSHKMSNYQAMWVYGLKNISGSYEDVYLTNYFWKIS